MTQTSRCGWTFEFSLNDFLWIQQIQWNMIKSKNSMVTGDTLYLTIDTFLDVVVKKNFSQLSLGWCLFRVVGGNRYLPRGSNENALFISNTGNVFLTSWLIPLVKVPLLDLVMIHWIRWIQWKSFRKNSNTQLPVVRKQATVVVETSTIRSFYWSFSVKNMLLSLQVIYLQPTEALTVKIIPLSPIFSTSFTFWK